MLIVVAIIAILVAVSIPLVGNSMDKAQHAADAANERAAKAQIVLAQLMKKDGTTPIKIGYYDAAAGTVIADGSKIAIYGKHHENKILAVEYVEATGTADPTVKMAWVAHPGSSTNAPSSVTHDTDKLCSTTAVDKANHKS